MAGGKDGDDPNAFVLYRYEPSLIAAAIFVVLFGLTTTLHVYQMIRKRAWFLTPFVVGGLFQTIGYIGRILSSKDQDKLSPYIMQSLLLLLAPALYAASIYMILGRIILLTEGERFSLIRRTWLTKIFVSGDVICFLMQGAGGGIMATSKENMEMGEYVILGGLGVQIGFFGFFVIVAGLFHYRGRRHLAKLDPNIIWRKHIYTLYGTSLLILVRSLFRVIEYAQGNAGYLLRNEVFLYVFDAVLMFAVMVAMNVSHPGDIAIMLKRKDRGSAIQLVSTDKDSPTTQVQPGGPWS